MNILIIVRRILFNLIEFIIIKSSLKRSATIVNFRANGTKEAIAIVVLLCWYQGGGINRHEENGASRCPGKILYRPFCYSKSLTTF